MHAHTGKIFQKGSVKIFTSIKKTVGERYDETVYALAISDINIEYVLLKKRARVLIDTILFFIASLSAS